MFSFLLGGVTGQLETTKHFPEVVVPFFSSTNSVALLPFKILVVSVFLILAILVGLLDF